MAANLRLIMYAAQAHARELDAECAGDALTERGLAYAGRADEAQDRAAALRVQLAHREVLDDAALDLLEAVVILIEHASRVIDVDRLVVELRPRQLDHPVDPRTQHRVLGARIGHPLEALQFLARLLERFLGHPGLVDRLAQLRDLFAGFAVLAQLLADLTHLFAQQRFLLTLVDGLARLFLDLTLQAQDLDALRHELGHAIQPRP